MSSDFTHVVRCVLASGSSLRSNLLIHAGIPHDIYRPSVDEASLRDAWTRSGWTTDAIASGLATAKAAQVTQILGSDSSDQLIIGSDQVLAFGEELFEKPKTREICAKRLALMADKTHTLITATVVFQNGEKVWGQSEHVELVMRYLDGREIETYLDEAEAAAGPALFDSVGGYRLEEHGIRLFDRINGDWHAALGLNLFPLCRFLRTRGVGAPLTAPLA